MRWLRRLVASITLIVSLGALGNWNDTSTGIDLEKLPRFPLTRVLSGAPKEGASVVFDGITATAPAGEREIRLQGSGISGKRWVAHLCGIDEVWRGDLDGNGKSDYVISSLGPYFNGRTTPPFSLSILLMDEGGLPVPFFTTVFHGENGMAVKNLVDLDHDGRAELLISTYDELASDPLAGTFSSGHWVTQLYRFRSLRAEEFSGTLGGMHFPFVHAWTYADHDPKRTPQPITDPILREHGTGTKADWQTVIRGRKESQLIINPVAGCNSIGDSLETIVYERSSRREIAFANLWTSASEKLMAAIRRDGASVQLGGIDKRKDETACSVKLIWATAKSSK